MGQVKWWLILVYGVILGAIIIAAIYLLKIEPVYSKIAFIPAYISSSLSKLNIGSLIMNNWGSIVAFGIPIVGLGAAVIKTKMNEAATQKALEAQTKLTELTKTEANTAITNAKNSASEEVTTLKEKLRQYEDDPTLGTLQDSYSKLKSQLDFANNQTQTIQNMHESFLTKLTSAANNQTITDPLTGKTLYVIKETVTQIK